MSFEILSAYGEDAVRWSALIEALPAALRDIHYLPEYGQIYHHSYNYEPLLAVYQSEDGFVLQPFVRRPLAPLAFLADAADACIFSDIANAYGFGGPLAHAVDQAAAKSLYRRFADAFGAWCEDENVASEFASLHPFFFEHQLALVEGILTPHHEKDIFYIDLQQDEIELWNKLRKGHRSSIKLARRNNVIVEKVEPTSANLSTLNELYFESMRRRFAASRWIFPDDFFAQTVQCLGPARSSLFFGYRGTQVESAYLIIHDFGTVYYHFSGTRVDDGQIGVDALMFYEMARWSREAGYRRCHLGGGATRSEHDGLLRFKSGFSSNRAPLYTYFCVSAPSIYDDLCMRKKNFEIATTGQESSSKFLPLYRR